MTRRYLEISNSLCLSQNREIILKYRVLAEDPSIEYGVCHEALIMLFLRIYSPIGRIFCRTQAYQQTLLYNMDMSEDFSIEQGIVKRLSYQIVDCQVSFLQNRDLIGDYSTECCPVRRLLYIIGACQLTILQDMCLSGDSRETLI